MVIYIGIIIASHLVECHVTKFLVAVFVVHTDDDNSHTSKYHNTQGDNSYTSHLSSCTWLLQ